MQANGRSIGQSRWRWAAWAGLILFALIQILPSALSSQTGGGTALSRDEAKRQALLIASERFGISADRVDRVLLVHTSNSKAVGYFSKEELLSRYQQEWEPNYPTDVYRADLVLAAGEGTLTLMLQMHSGQLVGWKDESGTHPAAGASQSDKRSFMDKAMAYASFFGVRAADWEPAEQGAPGTAVFHSRKSALGEARVRLEVQVPPGYEPASSAFPRWQGGSVTYAIEIPGDFTAYVEDQTRLSSRLNAIGFIVPHLVLFVMAIVYAGTRRKHTSFRRGIGFASVFFLFYVAFTFNMIPGLRAQVLEEGLPADDPLLTGVIVSTLIVVAVMAAFTYFSAVGGDGLWNSMGRSLWPRWRDRGFGDSVVVSMKQGYKLAFILMGVQSVILLGLQHGIGMFQASDATQSTYNMTYPWLLLLLAWCAGISEEIQSRFFGIALFRSWLVGGAKKVLGREPGKRSAAVLTLIAMLPPGLFWAFGHVSYAVYPAYSRVIELVLMGLLFGWFMLRFGLLAVIFAHITLDSFLMATQMVFDGLPGNLPVGILGIFLPAIVAYVIWWLHRGAAQPRPAG
ncbi:CPBP family intramembrane metalloprotease [Cohnella pontilimi]|uniref:CPBP family intramembrane metalloprotease n=1 Tax=Cohnella pontilimi TaxID=2564100 RepID=A0A4U0F5B1_9BACL|nr:CPBP family intramembrane glutamic endopeptidase [Cohnella pontilimi]TJY39773.1 CPBP family intramembrane metalloprotease [Cohnella pontilimi]